MDLCKLGHLNQKKKIKDTSTSLQYIEYFSKNHYPKTLGR
jgi:hypothetical protein